MRISISIPNTLFQEAEKLSNRAGISRSKLYARALEDYVKRQRSKGIKQALNQVYKTESSKLDPVIAQMQARAIGRGKW